MTKGSPRILVIGGAGQVGWELVRTLAPLGEIVVRDRRSTDLTNLSALRDDVRELKPAVIINAAAYTHVDKAESEQDVAYRVNAEAPGLLAVETRRLGAVLVHYSTDSVFDGTSTLPYTEMDPPAPLNTYSRSKLAGERAVMESEAQAYIFRVSWVYGLRGRNFLLTMRRLAGEGAPLRVVSDQFGSPTWARIIAQATTTALSKLCDARKREASSLPCGIYHMTAPDFTTWHEFAEAIVSSTAGNEVSARRVEPITSDQFPAAAVRPRFSVLDSGKLAKTFGIRLPSWRQQLQLCVASERDVAS